MRHINPVKAGLAVGAVLGLWHLMWGTLVAVGAARPLMDFVPRLHFIQLRYEMAPFVPGTAALLVAITFGVGVAFGLVFALVWNWLSRRPEAARTSENSGTAAAVKG